MKRILIMGAHGFVGSYLTQHLLDRGYEVIGSHLIPPAPDRRYLFPSYPLDISDRKAFRKLVKKIRPDAVIHLSGISILRKSWADVHATYRINTLGTIHLLEAVKDFSPDAKILFVSTSQVYGFSAARKRLTENVRPFPKNPYAVSKYLSELACFNFMDRYGVQTVIARPTNHIGPGMPDGLAFSDWCAQIARIEKGELPPVLKVGDIQLYRDFLHVRDVAAAYQILLEKGTPGEIYNIASEQSKQLSHYVRLLQSWALKPLKIERLADLQRSHEIQKIQFAARKIKLLGWKPRHSVENGLHDLLIDHRKQLYV